MRAVQQIQKLFQEPTREKGEFGNTIAERRNSLNAHASEMSCQHRAGVCCHDLWGGPVCPRQVYLIVRLPLCISQWISLDCMVNLCVIEPNETICLPSRCASFGLSCWLSRWMRFLLLHDFVAFSLHSPSLARALSLNRMIVCWTGWAIFVAPFRLLTDPTEYLMMELVLFVCVRMCVRV